MQILALCLWAVVGSPLALSSPQDSPKDPAIKKALDTEGLTYGDGENFYTVNYTFTDTKRKHAVYIRKVPEAYRSLKVHEVFGICYDSPNEPPAAKLLEAFQKRYVMGGLVLEAPSESQKNWRIRFRYFVDANESGALLRNVLVAVGSIADVAEQELSGKEEDKL